MAGENDSKEFIDTYGFFSSEPSFFERITYFLNSLQEPKNLKEAIARVDECILFYQRYLLDILQKEPYSKIHSFVVNSLGGNDLMQISSSADDSADFYDRAKIVCEKSRGIAAYEIGRDFKKYKDAYIELLNRISLVKLTVQSKGDDRFLSIFKVYSRLALMECAAMKGFFMSEEYIRHANSPKFAKGQKNRYKNLSDDTGKAVFEVIKRMISGDTRLHDKIADDVVHEFNDQIVNKIRKELKVKYPNYDMEGHQDMEKYKQEYRKRTHGKLVSKGRVNDSVFDFALHVYGQANDPQKSTRNIIPIIRRDKEKE